MRSVAEEAKRVAQAPQLQRDRQAKRASWSALQTHCPGLADQVPAFAALAERFHGRVSTVAVHATETVCWGDLDAEDREWMEGA